MKWYILLFLSLFCGVGVAVGQNLNPYPIDPSEIEGVRTPVAPDVAALGKFAMQPPSFATGTIEQSIPLFTIDENGLSYPLTLNYSYSGLHPAEEATTVGLGWVLSEGVITRIVKGLPDDNNSYLKKFEDNNYFNLTSVEGYGVNDPNVYPQVPHFFDFTANRIYNKYYDGQPDEYIFNFNGHTGRFLFLRDTAYVYPYGAMKVRKNGTDFVIDTPDGLEYTFMAADWSMTWHFDADQNNMITDYYGLGCPGFDSYLLSYEESPTTNAWRLKQVYNKNTKATINFTYASYSEDKTRYDIGAVSFYSDPTSAISNAYYAHSSFENISTPNQGPPSHTQSVFYYLTGITSDNYTVSFQLAGRNDFASATTAKAVSEIDVYNKQSTLVKSISLAHDYFNSSTNYDASWLKLTGVTINGQGVNDQYQFSYNENPQLLQASALFKETYGIDHWGYYNGQPNQYMVPYNAILATEADRLQYVNVNGLPWADKDPDFDHASLFALTQIKYPTGGYSNISYESGGGRGIRVSATEDNDGVHSYKKYYSYYPDQPVPAPDYKYELYSMDAVQTPCDVYLNSTLTSLPSMNYLTITASTRITLDYFDDNSNFYPQVTEYIGTPDGQGGRTVYNYIRDEESSYQTFLTEKDQYAYGGTTPLKKLVNTYDIQMLRYVDYWSDPTMLTMGNCVTCLFSADGGTIVYESPKDSLSGEPYLLSDVRVGVADIPMYWYKLARTDEYDYQDAADSVVNTTQYVFYTPDASGWPKSEAPIETDHLRTDGKTHMVKNYYPGDADPDNPGSNLGPTQMWQSTDPAFKYYISPVVKSKTYVDAMLTAYDQTTYTYNGSQDAVLKTAYEEHPAGSGVYNRYFYFYNNYAQLLAAGKQNDLTTSQVWDYNHHFVVASVKNADSFAVAYTGFEADGTGNWTVGSPARDATAAITGSRSYVLNSDISKSGLSPSTTYVVTYWTENGSPYTIAGTIAGYPRQGKTEGTWTFYEHKVTGQSTIGIGGSGHIDDLRLYPDGAQMTSYTYAPLTGMTSSTAANDIITYYEYDGSGRLLRIRDEDKNILKQFDYQYLVTGLPFYNIAESGTFTKNNCSAGLGSSVTYTVAANIYGSHVSQADANQQAINDVNANGQNYANVHGYCYFSSAAKSGTYTKAGCNPSGTATVTYVVAAGKYTSLISQADADQQAQNDVNANGQNYANTRGACSWINAERSVTLTRNNCGSGSAGSAVTYTVPAGRYSSLISQADADQQAINDVNANAQNYANANGTCTPMTTLWYENYSVGAASVVLTNVSTGDSYYFTMFPGTATLGTIPSGTYNVTFTASASQNVGFGCGLDGTGPTAVFYNVDIDNCDQLYASDNGN